MFKTPLARDTWNRKYRYGNESEIQTWERVARAMASVEKDPEKWFEPFLNAIVKFDKDKKATDDAEDATDDSFDTTQIRSLTDVDDEESIAEAKRNLAKNKDNVSLLILSSFNIWCL